MRSRAPAHPGDEGLLADQRHPTLLAQQAEDALHAPAPPPRACLAAALGGFSDNTRRAIRSDFGIFDAWCRARPLPALPAAPATVVAFVDAMAAARAPATVRRYVASIAAAHRALGHDRAATKSPAVRLALQRMHRAKGRRQAQALALTWPLRQRLLAASGDRLIDVRNRALLALAYDTMLRRSELAALRSFRKSRARDRIGRGR